MASHFIPSLAGETGRGTLPPAPQDRRRFPSEIISHTIWRYHAFSLSLRDVEAILIERGVIVSYKTVRCRYKKFAPILAAASGGGGV